MKVRLLRTAFEDLAAGRRFYERQQVGIGDYFLENLFSAVDSLDSHAGIHRKHFGFHRLLARRFPYAIYYKVIDGEAVVFRVLDCRRDPRWIRDNLVKAK